MWIPQTVVDRIASRSLLSDSMFTSLDSDSLLDIRDDLFDDDWIRAAEYVQFEWDSYADAGRANAEIDIVREAAFKRTYGASGGDHNLAAMVSEDFELICRRALLGVELPFVIEMEQAYDAQKFPH